MSVRDDLVTRERLGKWRFRRMPDTWLPCPVEGRRKYFERWYQAEWNFTALVGYGDRDPLQMTEEDFLALVQAYLLNAEKTGRLPWEELPAEN